MIMKWKINLAIKFPIDIKILMIDPIKMNELSC